VNTTALITHWSMEGTMRDLLRGRDRPEDPVEPSRPEADAAAALAEAVDEANYVLVKRPDDDEWQPLVSDE
jgi:hypothetical protein